jgi:hypothetical protein
MKKSLLLAGAAVLAATSYLDAAVITQTKTFGGTPNYSGQLTFDKFDTMGGIRTLTGVTVFQYLMTEAVGGVGVDNDGANPASGTVTMGTKLTVSRVNPNPFIRDDEGEDTLIPIMAVTSKHMTLSGDDGDGLVFSTVGSDYDEMLIQESVNTGIIVIGEDYWSRYFADGGGTFQFNYAVDQFTDFSSFGGAQTLINPMAANGYVQVTYEYIPEPGSVSLITLVVGIAAWIRRRFSE